MDKIETVRFILRRKYMQRTANWRRKKIASTDWTIISNNCWAGFIYQSYGLQYRTPTLGLFFMADDYLEFVSDLKKWLEAPMHFIEPEKSKHYEDIKHEKWFGTYPICVLDNNEATVELHCLHYNSPEDFLKHWTHRIHRINWNKIVYKFNDQNLCTEEHIKKFAQLPLQNKICFTMKEYNLPNTYYIRCPKNVTAIPGSYEPFGSNRHININDFLNQV